MLNKNNQLTWNIHLISVYKQNRADAEENGSLREESGHACKKFSGIVVECFQNLVPNDTSEPHVARQRAVSLPEMFAPVPRALGGKTGTSRAHYRRKGA